MAEQLGKKMSEEEMQDDSVTNEPVQEVQTQSQPTEATAVDTGRRVDVSKVMLKKNMVRTVEKKDEEHVPAVESHGGHENEKREAEARVATPIRPRSPHRPKSKTKAKPKEIEVVRRPHLENGSVGHEALSLNHSDPATHVLRPEPAEWDESGDFASMLDASGPITKMEVNVGDRVRARLIHVAGDTAFFSFSSRYEGSMPLNELRRESGEYICQVGDEIDAYVVSLSNGIMLSLKMGKNMADLNMLQEAKDAQIPVEGTVTGVNAGGYDVSIAGTRGFCPLGQIGVEFIEDPKKLIGRSLLFLVAKLTEGGRNIVLNRRKLLERERQERQKERLKTLQVGDRVQGKISRLAEFGAFVDLDGVDGLVPNSELGFSRVTSASDRVKVGDIVQVEVMKIGPDPKREGHMRIGLSLKAAMPDPFEVYRDRLVAGQTLEGKVARLETFGAFIELFDGIDGLIHISELSEQRVRHPSEVLKIGDPVTVRILDVDFEKKRVSLSLRENVQREKEKGHEKEKARAPSLNRGAMVEGVVERIERYGVFLKLGNGQTALLPSSESGTPRGADLSKFFELGTSLPVMVIDIDDRGRVRVSKMAREQADERAVYENFNQKQKAKSTGFGTLGDLLNKKLKVN